MYDVVVKITFVISSPWVLVVLVLFLVCLYWVPGGRFSWRCPSAFQGTLNIPVSYRIVYLILKNSALSIGHSSVQWDAHFMEVKEVVVP